MPKINIRTVGATQGKATPFSGWRSLGICCVPSSKEQLQPSEVLLLIVQQLQHQAAVQTGEVLMMITYRLLAAIASTRVPWQPQN